MDTFQEVNINPEYDNIAYQPNEDIASSSSPPQTTSSSAPPTSSLSAPPDSSSSPLQQSTEPSSSSSSQPLAPSSSSSSLSAVAQIETSHEDKKTTNMNTISTTSNDIVTSPAALAVGVNDSASNPNQAYLDSGIKRDRPHSSSVISRVSNFSTRSKVSLSPTLVTSEFVAAKLYSYKDGKLDNAVDICKNKCLVNNSEVFKGAWLLTQINEWNLEFEKVFLLTDQTIYMVKFNFISNKVIHYKFFPLKDIMKLQIADLSYPKWTIMPKRDQGAIRIHTGEPVGMLEQWNPYSPLAPLLTITHHPTVYTREETETTTYNADDFAESVLTEATKVMRDQGRDLIVDESPIRIYSYAGLLSLIHNHSKIGYNLDRNGLSF